MTLFGSPSLPFHVYLRWHSARKSIWNNSHLKPSNSAEDQKCPKKKGNQFLIKIGLKPQRKSIRVRISGTSGVYVLNNTDTVSYRFMPLKPVTVDCVVFFLVILALVLFLKGCPDILCGTIAICPLWLDSRNLYLPVLVGKVALYTTAVLGNVGTLLQ